MNSWTLCEERDESVALRWPALFPERIAATWKTEIARRTWLRYDSYGLLSLAADLNSSATLFILKLLTHIHSTADIDGTSEE